MSRWFANWPSYAWWRGLVRWAGKEKQKMQAVVLTSKKTYLQGLSWAPQDNYISALSHHISKAYREALVGFSHMFNPEGLIPHCSPKAVCPWKWSPLEIVGRTHVSGPGRTRGASDYPQPASRSTSSHIILLTFQDF